MNFNWHFRNSRNSQGEDFENFTDGYVWNDSSKDDEMKTFDVPFMEPFGNMEDTTRGLFQHMEDMFNHMFSSSFVPIGPIMIKESTANDPRSVMLKDPDCKRCEEHHDFKSPDIMIPDNFIDSDIDEQVARQGLLLDEKKDYLRPQQFSYKKFSSIRTVHLPDGTVEEHRKFTDSQGNEISTIRRAMGDQSYEVTTRTDSEGITEKQENLTNLDESELSEFEKRWQNIKTKKLPIEEPRTDLMLPKSTPVGDPSYLSIFKKFFGL